MLDDFSIKETYRALEDVMTLLQEKDDIFFEHQYCRRCWFIRSGEEVFFEIKRNMVPYQGKKPRTYDLHYVHLPLARENTEEMRTAIYEALGYKWQRINATPITRDLPNLDWLIEHIEFLIFNKFLSNKTGNFKHKLLVYLWAKTQLQKSQISPCMRMKLVLLKICWEEEDWWLWSILTLGGSLRPPYKEWIFPVIRYAHGTSTGSNRLFPVIFIGINNGYAVR